MRNASRLMLLGAMAAGMAMPAASAEYEIRPREKAPNLVALVTETTVDGLMLSKIEWEVTL